MWISESLLSEMDGVEMQVAIIVYCHELIKYEREPNRCQLMDFVTVCESKRVRVEAFRV